MPPQLQNCSPFPPSWLFMVKFGLRDIWRVFFWHFFYRLLVAKTSGTLIFMLKICLRYSKRLFTSKLKEFYIKNAWLVNKKQHIFSKFCHFGQGLWYFLPKLVQVTCGSDRIWIVSYLDPFEIFCIWIESRSNFQKCIVSYLESRSKKKNLKSHHWPKQHTK